MPAFYSLAPEVSRILEACSLAMRCSEIMATKWVSPVFATGLRHFSRKLNRGKGR